MSSDSVAAFLETVRTTRLLPPDRLNELVRDGAGSMKDVRALASDFATRGLLTRYQAGLVAGGRGGDLVFAGYPITDEIGPYAGGMAYGALHPVLRSAVVLRRYRPEWFPPVDTPGDFVRRAREACPITHPRLARLLDAGVTNGEVYAVLEPLPGMRLDLLMLDLGTVPGSYAAEYGRNVADALAAAHAKGVAHGDVRPQHLFVGPLVQTSRTRADGTPKFRPCQEGTATLSELGLVPRRPPAAERAEIGSDDVAFLAPERLAGAGPTPAGDVYSLGATLFYALTARYPVRGKTARELVANAAGSEPRSLAKLRPDLPAEFVAVIRSLLHTDPARRPAAADVDERLAPFAPTPRTVPAIIPHLTSTLMSDIFGGATRPGDPPPQPRAVEQAVAAPQVETAMVPVPDAGPAEVRAAAPPHDEWTGITYPGPVPAGGVFYAVPDVYPGPISPRPWGSDPVEVLRWRKMRFYTVVVLCLGIASLLLLMNLTGFFSFGDAENNPPGPRTGGPRK